ncbi:arabinose ABC transporter permease [Paenibacillus elgii]|uniref:Arabinose ABC transporter permease n=1 Tax=Paenibacillus elgii TaxID=189691 RepID=A0A163UDE9_9BACL|nr:MFS transporter [Paenibacillus elgii]KZE73171.1 arabinose ABC transporter permease [Paenibacillus elgii]
MQTKKSFLAFPIALGVFGIINTEFGIVGILPQIAEHFQISTSQAGMLVSMFALIIAVSGPFMTLLFSGINRKKILAGVLAVFAISNLFSAFAPTFTALLLFRLLPAFLHPVYFSVAFAAAASSVAKEQSATTVAKVFIGLTVGMVIGVPITSFIGDQFSLKAAFLFSSIIHAIALVGIAAFIPSLPVKSKLSYGEQLTILTKPQLWLNIAAACFILAALYSVYSYFAEYLKVVTGMNGKIVSVMLVLFGASGIFGNLQAAKYVSKNRVKTIVFYPLVLGAIYLLIFCIGSYSIPMIAIIIVWGAVFTGGLIVSQTWLTSEAPETPEFANSLFVSFANLGVTLGTALGGWFLAYMGTRQITWSGVLFLVLASVCI